MMFIKVEGHACEVHALQVVVEAPAGVNANGDGYPPQVASYGTIILGGKVQTIKIDDLPAENRHVQS